MSTERIHASYLIETPFAPEAVAEVMAGEQSCGTFKRVEGETDALRARARANVERIEALETVAAPSLPNALLERQGNTGPWQRARVHLSFPVANIGANLPTLAATVAGNLYDLGESTGMRLETLQVPADYRRRFEMPRVGIAGTRAATGVASGALVGTIIKPNVGFSAAETAELVGRLCAAGVDFIKDDEVCADPDHAPLAERVPAVMASLNWCGYSAIQALRRHTPLALHGHRNGFGALSRHPLLGMGYQAYQVLWRLAGVDHMHVHGLDGKFAQPDSEVIEGARDSYTPLAIGQEGGLDDTVMPAFSSGQWAGTVPATWAAVQRDDLLFMSGGGILAHPGGAAAGVASIRQAWAAVRAGQSLQQAAQQHAELAQALALFGR